MSAAPATVAHARVAAPSGRGGTIGRGIAASAAVHAALVFGALALAREAPRLTPAPVYRVALVAAPASSGAEARPLSAAPRVAGATGITSPVPRIVHPDAPARAVAPKPVATKPTAATKPAAAPAAREHSPASEHAGAPVTRPAHVASHAAVHTPSPPSAHAPAATATPTKATAATKRPVTPPSVAAAGVPTKAAAVAHAAARPTPAGRSTGGPTARGRDVADVRAVGLDFPYPGYLDNLVRQVRVRFAPTESRAGLHADLAFVVARDGSISGLRVVRGSGNYAFDLEAQGAVEAAGAARAFGPLPDGFHPSALPVTFSFDPRSTP